MPSMACSPTTSHSIIAVSMRFPHDAKKSENSVDSKQSIFAVAPFRVVAPCPAPQKPYTPPRPTAGFRLNDYFQLRGPQCLADFIHLAAGTHPGASVG